MESTSRELNKDLMNTIKSMGGFKVKTKSIIAESLKPSSEQEEKSVGMLDENNLLDEI